MDVIKFLVKLTTIISALLLINLSSCRREEVPLLSAPIVSNIEVGSATCTATIIDEGSGPVKEYGICWSKEKEPTIYDYKTFRKGRAIG